MTKLEGNVARHKYKKGDVIRNLVTLVGELEAGHPVFLHERVESAKWLMEYNLTVLFHFTNSGAVAFAVEEEKPSDAR